jgi:signal transduction histidine kinase
VEGAATIRREECEVETRRGRRTLGLTAHPLRQDDGQVRGHLVLFADLTEVKRRLSDERLSDSLRQLGEITAGVAHEMRNGLATLSVQDYAGEIRVETEHLHRVLEDFLAFARPGTLRLEDVDLAAMAHRVAADPSFAAAEVRVEIAGRLGEEFKVRGDGMLLARAVANLVKNAVEAQEEGRRRPRVELRLGYSPSETGEPGVELQVLDRGRGIPPELRDELFTPFATGRAGGVGLGLALARRIVLLHQGRIRLVDRDGGGAAAEIWLPDGKDATESNSTAAAPRLR